MAAKVRPAPRWEEPLQTTYREDQVFAPSLSTWGGVNNVEALNLLELADLKSSGPYTTSPRSLLWLMQIAECHKVTWYQHGLSGRHLSPKSRATKGTAACIWSQMQSGKWAWLPNGVRKNAERHSDGIVAFAPLAMPSKPTSRVGIISIGGLGHMAVKFAASYGCDVTAFTSSESKFDEAKGFGADHVVSSKDSAAIRKSENSPALSTC